MIGGQEQGRFKYYIGNVDHYNYHDLGVFNTSLKDEGIARVFMRPLQLWGINSHNIAFVDNSGAVHSFLLEPENSDPNTNAFELIPQLVGKKLVSGEISVPTQNGYGEIYQSFIPEFENHNSSLEEVKSVEEQNYTDWMEAAKEVMEKGGKCRILYYRAPKHKTIDLTSGINHVATVVGIFNSFTLKDLKTAFPKVPLTDMTGMVHWGKNVNLSPHIFGLAKQL